VKEPEAMEEKKDTTDKKDTEYKEEAK